VVTFQGRRAPAYFCPRLSIYPSWTVRKASHNCEGSQLSSYNYVLEKAIVRLQSMPKSKLVLAPKRYCCDHAGCTFSTDFSASFATHKATAHGSNERKEETNSYYCK